MHKRIPERREPLRVCVCVCVCVRARACFRPMYLFGRLYTVFYLRLSPQCCP